MFEPKEPENARINEAPEEKLLELQNNIQRVERKLRLAEKEKKADTLEGDSNAKKNDLEIKRLRMEVQELEDRLKRGQKADENVMHKEFQKHFRDFGNSMGKSAKEVRRQLDAEAIELQRRSKSLEHELELKARTLCHSEEQFEEMTSSCDAYFENEPTEFHSLQFIRELENEYQKIGKYITESEIAERVLKQMKNQLEKSHLSNVFLLQAVQREHEQLLHQESEAQQVAGANEKATQLGENALSDLKKEVRFLEEGKPDKPSEQEAQLLQMKLDFEKIKETTGVADIQEAESRFLEQKDLEENLSEVRRTFARTLRDLKVEKKQLDSKMELLQGSGARCPERELGDELSQARARLKEQQRRKERTARELEKIGSLLAALEGRTHKLVQTVRKELPHIKMEIKPDMAVSELIKKLEEILRKSENVLSRGNCQEI